MTAGLRRQRWVSRKDRLDRLFASFDRISATDAEVRAHWVRYLVVLTSGFLETAVSYIYTEFAAAKSSEKVGRYVASRLAAPANLNMDKLEKLIRDFDDGWFDELRRHPEYGEISSAVDSVVSNRNRVAHGDDISTTIGQLRGYYEGILKLLDILQHQCDQDVRPERARR